MDEWLFERSGTRKQFHHQLKQYQQLQTPAVNKITIVYGTETGNSKDWQQNLQ